MKPQPLTIMEAAGGGFFVIVMVNDQYVFTGTLDGARSYMPSSGQCWMASNKNPVHRRIAPTFSISTICQSHPIYVTIFTASVVDDRSNSVPPDSPNRKEDSLWQSNQLL
ncbi:hypothetical protein F3Y22_tig00110020pilonHSYRG00111 [Hibiscus syriacus]|uniref:Uncharacterized protein n=1 Tax=Hibiscus syriacus TaxID=106335 RepID=A0A6A3BPR7_HIBSY|nr:hypothetical protein F3Y22_tig00110020pilonHSYRG00111 [Hibiscus syriacus]